MFRNYTDNASGIFGVCMGLDHREPTEHHADAVATMQDTESAFEAIMSQTARAKFDDDLHIRLALSALIGAWQCVVRARAGAGY